MTIEWPYMMETITVCDALDAGKCRDGVMRYIESHDMQIEVGTDIDDEDIRQIARRNSHHLGYGYGSGYGDGSGYGPGYGDGSGDGPGYGDGDGCGSGDGSGDGYGIGCGYGSGDGYSGDGHGDGYGSVSSSGQYME